MDDSVDQYDAPAHGAGAYAANGSPSSGANLLTFPSRKSQPVVAFDRKEMGIILNLYGTYVAAGEWRDYGMDFGKDMAVFAVYRRSAEQPLYRIVKNPALARRQGAYAVLGQNGQVLKRGHDLHQVLRVLALKEATY